VFRGGRRCGVSLAANVTEIITLVVSRVQHLSQIRNNRTNRKIPTDISYNFTKFWFEPHILRADGYRMQNIDEKREALGLPESLVGEDGTEVYIGGDVCDWIAHLAYPCEVPYGLKVIPGPADNHQIPALILTIGPEGSLWARYEVSFAKNGTWLSVSSIGRTDNSAPLPEPALGFNAADAAHLLGVEMERNWFRSPWSWQSYRKQQGKAETTDAWKSEPAEKQKRLQHLARLKVSSQVHIAALEALAAEHPEEYAKHYEAQQVIKALSSDWFPDPKVR